MEEREDAHIINGLDIFEDGKRWLTMMGCFPSSGCSKGVLGW
jgi:hypothetical protein